MFFVLTDNQRFNFLTQQKSPEINRGFVRSIDNGVAAIQLFLFWKYVNL